jgi:hypothetical protein
VASLRGVRRVVLEVQVPLQPAGGRTCNKGQICWLLRRRVVKPSFEKKPLISKFKKIRKKLSNVENVELTFKIKYNVFEPQ